MKSKGNTIHMWMVAALGKGISGGDRICIELARRWSHTDNVVLYVWKEGKEMVDRQKLRESKSLVIKEIPVPSFVQKSFPLCYFYRIYSAVKIASTLNLENKDTTILYSATEFWMDVLPVFVLKQRFSKARWVATWFQTAPNPIRGFAEKNRREKYRLHAFLYWIMQLPMKPLVKYYSDKVIVNNEDEKRRFPLHTSRGDTIVLIGAVPLEDIKRYKLSAKSHKPVFDAVFQGRFHPQKGVIELIDIWSKVVEEIPTAKLAMIGDGPLREDVEMRIKNLELSKNVELLGYVFDGQQKYRIFSRSKIVVHPAFYDSGGMATAEAMAFGIPAIGFDLKAYESYYPKGMVRVKDENAFAQTIIDLLNNTKKRERLGKEAYNLIEKSYSWNMRANEIKNIIFNI